MLDHIPFILKEEQETLQTEIKDKYISVIYDGTTRLGEVLAIIVRYIDDWKIKQRLIRLETLAKSMTGEEIARELIDVLSRTYRIQSNHILAVMRDGASVNNVALRVLQVVFPDILNVCCFSHTFTQNKVCSF